MHSLRQNQGKVPFFVSIFDILEFTEPEPEPEHHRRKDELTVFLVTSLVTSYISYLF
jgi:hypothetical protein